MKSYALIFFFSFLALSACSTQWDKPKPELSEEQIAYHEEILENSLDGLKEAPDSIDFTFEVAFRYHQLGEWENAVEYYGEVLALNENHDVALNNLAVLYEDLEDYDQAAEYIKRLYVLSPDSIEVIKDTVRILLEADQGSEAQQALDNFVSIAMSSENSDAIIQEVVSDLKEDIEEWKKQAN